MATSNGTGAKARKPARTPHPTGEFTILTRERVIVCDFSDGTTHRLTIADVMGAPWFAEVSPSTREMIEAHADGWNKQDMCFGARDFCDLLQRIRGMGDILVQLQVDRARDYSAMADDVQTSIERGLTHQAPSRRKGFLLALTELLSIVADGCGTGDDWIPEAMNFAEVASHG